MRLDLTPNSDTPDPVQSAPRLTPAHSGSPGESEPRRGHPVGGAAAHSPAAQRRTSAQPDSDPDELVSCKGCFRPTSSGVAGKNNGHCQACSDQPRETP